MNFSGLTDIFYNDCQADFVSKHNRLLEIDVT